MVDKNGLICIVFDRRLIGVFLGGIKRFGRKSRLEKLCGFCRV